MNEQLKMIYKIIYDDLKDADMLVGYAKNQKDIDKEFADSMIKEAKIRINHMLVMHEQFAKMVSAGKNKEKEAEVHYCLWDVTHQHYVDWYESIENCINKWK